MLVRLVPVGNPPKEILDYACFEIQDILKSKCRVLSKLEIPRQALNHFRRQYNAEKIIDLLIALPEVKFIDKNIPTVLLTDADIYYAGLNFVFGLEYPEKNCCIISIARLRPEFYNQIPNSELLKDRLVKEVVHEIGHHLGLEHCRNAYCVMCFSPSVNDVDIKQKNFCNDCKIKMMTRGISLG